MRFPLLKLDPASAFSLPRQLAEQIHRAISSGDIVPGDVLPTQRQMAQGLGVSLRVPREAIALLAAEGLVRARSRQGCVVLPKRVKVWKARVLLIEPNSHGSYYYSAFSHAFAFAFLASGCYEASVIVDYEPGGRFDVDTLKAALRINAPDLVVVMYNMPAIERFLSTLDIPFVAIGGTARTRKNRIGCLSYRPEAALDDVIVRCRERGIRSVEQVGYGNAGALDAVPTLKKAGFSVMRWILPPDPDDGSLDGIVCGAMKGMIERSRHGRRLSDLFLVTDDFTAKGMLIGALAAGLRLPEDVRFVVFSNRGFAPVHPVSLARIEMDPEEDGRLAAVYSLDRLRGGSGAGIALGSRFIDGDSMGCPETGKEHGT